jgi:hypothetical protein
VKIYLAGSYYKRVALATYAHQLTQDGHVITSEWLTGIHEKPPWTPATYSQHDLECIRAAEVFMAFTEADNVPTEYKRGGRHFEAGYAYAHAKRLVIVGPRENAFYHLLNFTQYDTFEAARTSLKPAPPKT